MPRILESFPGTTLTVAGDGPLRRVYERAARPLGAAVRFVGRVNGERPEYYGTADLYLCPTTKASFGITLLEAMACGTPLIASDIVGFRELVDGGGEAVLVPPRTPDAWADAVVDLIGDPSRRAAMGATGRTKAGAYAWPRVADRILEVYRRVLR
jgi:phosphatidyl-myo-inositol alpha-mannosyltransferase